MINNLGEGLVLLWDDPCPLDGSFFAGTYLFFFDLFGDLLWINWYSLRQMILLFSISKMKSYSYRLGLLR